MSLMGILIVIGVTFFVKKMTIDEAKYLSQENAKILQSKIYAESHANLRIASLYSSRSDILAVYDKISEIANLQNENDPYLQEARQSLRELLKTEVLGYQNITQNPFKIHFHVPQARSLLRLWREKQAKRNGQWVDISDDLSTFRKTILSLSSQNVSSLKGIELGRGGFAIRGLSSIYGDQGNQYLGSVEVISSFSDLLKNNPLPQGHSLSVLMPKKYLEITTKLRAYPKT